MEREAGRIEVITGPMFAGKSEELLRRVRRASIGGRRVQVFTHVLDDRGGAHRVTSHVGLEHPSRSVDSAGALAAEVAPAADVVAIDEAHFFGAGLVEVASELARRGHTVLVAGLDVTFAGRPFEPLPTLMALAERVDKLTAICVVCGRDAVYHVRTSPEAAEDVALVSEHVGGVDKYEARCRRHFPA